MIIIKYRDILIQTKEFYFKLEGKDNNKPVILYTANEQSREAWIYSI